MSRLLPVPAGNSPPVPYSGFWRRTVATAIDLTILLCLMGGVGLSTVLCVGMLSNDLGLSLGTAVIMAVMAVPWMYYAGLESSGMSGTVGKWLVGLEVTDLEHTPLSLDQASTRHLARCCSVLTVGIGYLFCLWTRRHQTLHDWLSNTILVYADDMQEESPTPDPN